MKRALAKKIYKIFNEKRKDINSEFISFTK